VRSGRGFDVVQHGADVNRLAVVTAVIFAKLFHAENFTQRRKDARTFFDPNYANE
jgi:threonine aldolase